MECGGIDDGVRKDLGIGMGKENYGRQEPGERQLNQQFRRFEGRCKRLHTTSS